MSHKVPLPSREEAIAVGLSFYGAMESLDENGTVCTADKEVATWVATMRTATDTVVFERVVPLGYSYAEHRYQVDSERQRVANYIANVSTDELAEETLGREPVLF